MPTQSAVVVSDAHLGFGPDEIARQFHRFLGTVPDLGSHLVINGDLFEFWFEYRTVIPRHAFPTLARLRELSDAGIRLTVTGGNHDRWGGPFWRTEIGAEYHEHAAELDVAGHRTRVSHGDGVADPLPASRFLQTLVHHRLTARVFRWIHPDLGLRLVRRLSRTLPGKRETAALYERSARAQATYARRLLVERADLRLLVMGHTHRPVVEDVGGGRWYLNPGAWMDGLRYATVGPDGPVLRRFTGDGTT